MKTEIDKLKEETGEVLASNILPYWMEKMKDEQNGGFYGRMSGNEQLMPQANKGAVLNARILWAFAAAYLRTGNEAYRQTAAYAERYFIDHFYDRKYGGVYWMLDFKGNPSDTHKQLYALGFALYGLSEYYRATGRKEALDYAIRLFEDIEAHGFDRERNGYIEAFAQDWSALSDVRLSEKDRNERKTANTHLHLLEPYTNLYKVWKAPLLKERLRNLVELFLYKIWDGDSGHLKLFFDDDWVCRSETYSYGHDIEAAWLLLEAASELGEPRLLKQTEAVAKRLVRAANEGYVPSKGMAYTYEPSSKHLDRERHWWVQAETVIGNLELYRRFGDVEALHRAVDTWHYIRDNLVDRDKGEWFWSMLPDGTPNRKDDKAGPWKCPYHNSRMCLKVLEFKGTS
jgi:mannobiose 2-epimerase